VAFPGVFLRIVAGYCLKIKIKPVARNVMEGFLLGVFAWVFPQFLQVYGKQPFIYQIHLTEPQGKLKNLLFFRVVL